jgi:hypothetical protein
METNDPNQLPETPLDGLRRYVPLLAWLLVFLVFPVIALKIIQYGYLPPDDALRHAAKAVSGKPWPEILVVGPAFQIDHNFGWHAFLRQIHRWTHCNTDRLVVFSVVLLFTIVGWSALPWLRRPEAWLISFTAMALTSGVLGRLTMGRPFLLTISGLLIILFVWQTRASDPPRWWTAVWMALLIAICTFVHGVWYLWSLPVAAFFLAGEFRWGLALAAGWVAGVFLGSSFTGHPFESMYQAVVMADRAFDLHLTARTMAGEFQPSAGDALGLILLGGLLVLRQLAGLKARPLSTRPAFWLAVIAWVLSFKAVRFSEDWGWPALMVLVTTDLQLFLESRFAADSFKRLALVAALTIVTFLATTNDSGSRWTYNLTQQYLTSDNPDLAGWMPEKGGILYSSDMTIFYQTFFKNPNGDWRYIVGYEPALMPDEDFRIYHKILWNLGDAKGYMPWVDKMRPEDRLVIRGGRGSPPNIPQLEWNYGVSGIWIGRLPRAHPAPGDAPATIPATAPRDHSTHSTSVPE